MATPFESARILIVDDEVALLEGALRRAGSVSLHTAQDPRAVPALYAEPFSQDDLLRKVREVLDLAVPA